MSALAPEKKLPTIRRSMGQLRQTIEERHAARKESRKAPRFAPAGQSTQVIVGADKSSDVEILSMSSSLYAGYKLKRVYYSAFSPIPDASAVLPLKSPPLVREHRLYQADWLYRFYGFSMEEIGAGLNDGMLDLAVDPKLGWALANRALFPVDINRAPREMLLRVPGLGTKAVECILSTRRFHAIRLNDLSRLTASVRKLLPFITAADWSPGRLTDQDNLKQRMAPPSKQLELFAA